MIKIDSRLNNTMTDSRDSALEILVKILKENEKQLESIITKIDHLELTINKTHKLVNQLNQPKQTQSDPRSKHILVVDDDVRLANSYKLILENEGHKVSTANSGLSALYQMKRNAYDLVILDWNLPDMLGDELADKIALVYEEIEIIFISGYSSIQSKSKYGDKVLLKPVDPEILIKRAS